MYGCHRNKIVEKCSNKQHLAFKTEVTCDDCLAHLCEVTNCQVAGFHFIMFQLGFSTVELCLVQDRPMVLQTFTDCFILK